MPLMASFGQCSASRRHYQNKAHCWRETEPARSTVLDAFDHGGYWLAGEKNDVTPPFVRGARSLGLIPERECLLDCKQTLKI